METLMNQTSLQPVDGMQQAYFPVEEFVALPENKYLSKSSLRHLIFNSRPRKSASGDVIPGNGLVEAGAIIRLGSRVLIDVHRFRSWLEKHREIVGPP